MKTIITSILVVMLLITSHVISAKEPEEDKRATISVTGVASEFFPPDIVTVTLSVETQSRTASESVAQNSKISEKVVNTLKALIDPSSGDLIKTSSFSVRPVYEYDTVRKKSVLTGYRAINQVTVKTTKVAAAGSVIDRAIESGANRVQNITFSLAEEKDYCDSVLKKAAEKARREAAVVAQSFGMKVTGIKHISPSCRKEFPPIPREMRVEAKAAEAPATPIEAGDIAVYGSVSVEFFIE